MQRVLQVNKFFFHNAGAETVYFQTRDLLASRGFEIVDFAMQDDRNLPSPYAEFFAPHRAYGDGGAGKLRKVRDASASVYGVAARRSIARLLAAHPVDIAHLHNVYHQLSLSIVDELARRHVPIVMTLHDWKIACPSYTLFLDGAPCRRCPSGSGLASIEHACVKGSRPASAIAFAELQLARRLALYDKVDHFIAPSAFAAEVAELAGVPPRRISVLPNFVPDRPEEPPAPTPTAAGSLEPADRSGVLFVGRLDDTKGVRVLLEAFTEHGAPGTLRIAGFGDLSPDVEEAARSNVQISYLGRLSPDEVRSEMRRATLVAIPSIWEENCPMVLLEAQQLGTPCVVSDRGGLPEFVRNEIDGLVVPAGNSSALAAAINRAVMAPELAHSWGTAARVRVREQHGADTHLQGLAGVYQAACDERHGRLKGQL